MSQHLHFRLHQRHSACLIHGETAFHAKAVGSRTPRPQFPSRTAEVLHSRLQTSCRPSLRSPEGKESPMSLSAPVHNATAILQTTIYLYKSPWRPSWVSFRRTAPTMINSSTSTMPQLTPNKETPRFLHGGWLLIPPNQTGAGW